VNEEWFCETCGEKLEGRLDYCPYCGSDLPAGYSWAPLEPPPPPPGEEKNKLPAGVYIDETVTAQAGVEALEEGGLIVRFATEEEKRKLTPMRIVIGAVGFIVIASLLFFEVGGNPWPWESSSSDTTTVPLPLPPPPSAELYLSMINAPLVENNPDSALTLYGKADSLGPLTGSDLQSYLDLATSRAELLADSNRPVYVHTLLTAVSEHVELTTGQQRLFDRVSVEAADELAFRERAARGEYIIGDPADIGSFTVTVERASYTKRIERGMDYFATNEVFILILLDVVSKSNEMTYFDMSKLLLTDAQGRVFFPQLDHLMLLNTTNALAPFESGTRRILRIPVVVPDRRHFVLHFGPNAFVGDPTVSIP
jgi:hypothetical protein